MLDIKEKVLTKRKLTKNQLRERLSSVKLLSLDVDGVLTDGGLYYADDGTQFRKFNVKDGLGMKRVMEETDVQMAIITANKKPVVQFRAADLGIEHVYVGTEDKLAALNEICGKLGLDLHETAHIGDDVNDVPVLDAVGCPLSVADAAAEARNAALYVTERKGGDAAVREICDLFLASRT